MQKMFSLAPAKANRPIYSIYLVNFILAFHYALVIYINSSFLSKFIPADKIGFLYLASAFISLFVISNISKIIKIVGNYRFIMTCIILEVVAILGLIFVKNNLVIFFFILHDISIPSITLSLDIFLENLTRKENITGGTRGTYLTLANSAFVGAPFVISFILTDDFYWRIYTLALSLLILLAYVVFKHFKSLPEANLKKTRVIPAIWHFIENKDILYIGICQFLLQFFYSLMVIYTPIYLIQKMGMGWAEVGTIFTIMLLPFVIFELPAGKLADRKLGEKEILSTGFIIMGLSTITIFFLGNESVILWAIVLFITRIGASFVEITTDSYFFKHVNGENADAISLYRLAKPFAYIAGPAVAAISFYLLDFKYLFVILGVIMLYGLRFSLAIKDTK